MFPLLFAFALSWAILRAAEEIGSETRTGISRARLAAAARARREARARAARIRRSGTRTERAALWIGTRGVAATRATGRGLSATGRGALRVGRSAGAGWRTGWAEGKDRHAGYAARQQQRRVSRAPIDDPATTAPAPDPDPDPTLSPRETEVAGDGEIGSSAFRTPGHPAGHTSHAQPEGETAMSIPTTGEAPNIQAAREALKAIAEEAEQTNTAIDSLSASLASADMDSQTLQEVSEILEAADNLKAAADHALAGLDSRHQVMEEAVNSTPHAAKTEFYRH